jgi:hypothetical protein
LGRGKEVAPSGAVGGILEVSPSLGIPFFTNHGQGLSISLTLFHPLGMFFKEKEQLHIGDFCPFAFPLAKQV